MRDSAAIGYDELAARAHFPSDVLKEAENGPLLPGLPILTAYVRACEGDVPGWEERWRRLTSEIPEDPDLPVRPPGASPAAVAGARAGVGIAPPDVYDPERIKAALRGGQDRSAHGGSAIAAAGARSKAGNGWGAAPSWDTSSDETISTANGDPVATSWSREPFDAPAEPDPAEEAGQFRWLPEEDALASSAEDDAGYGADVPAGDPVPAGSSLAAPAGVETPATEWAPRWDDAGKPAEGTDFWSAAEPATNLPQPGVAPRSVDDPDYAPTSWSEAAARAEAASSATTSALGPLTAETGTAGFGGSAGGAGSSGVAVPQAAQGHQGTQVPQASTHQVAGHQRDRFFPARLLVIIVIAALIGSALVLLLK